MTWGPHCRGCVLEKIGQGFALTDGRGDLGLLAVAEALGKEEAREKKPLVGAAGKVFNRIISRTIDPERKVPLKRDDFTLANVVNCRPPENVLVKAPYEQAAIDQCAPYLRETIRRLKPKAIIAMGNTPLRWFTGETGIESLRGYIFDTQYGPVIPTYHPSYIQRGQWHLVRVVQLDILKALSVARHGKPTRARKYISRPSIQDALRFKEAYKEAGFPLLAFDLETPYIAGRDKDEDVYIDDIAEEDDPSYNILMCSFSFREGEAITFPWIPPFIGIAQEILSSPGPKCGHNIRGFDVKRLVANGCPVRGRLYDTMDAWHFLEPALPMGLKYIATFMCPDMPPWRLMSTQDKPWYCAADSDVALRCMNRIRANLEKEQRWTTFERHFVDLGLVLDRVTIRGIQVDKALRKEARESFHARFEGEVKDLQSLVPESLKPKHFYKLSEEQLRKKKPSKTGELSWEEGKMRLLQTEIPLEEFEAAQAKTQKIAEKERVKLEKAALRAAKKLEKQEQRLSNSSPRRQRKTSPLEKGSSSSAPGARRSKRSTKADPSSGSSQEVGSEQPAH
jgi:uracil-DNA glycosylase